MTLFLSIAIPSIVSFLWFLSYKHYDSFRRIAYILIASIFVTFTLCIVYETAINSLKYKVTSATSTAIDILQKESDISIKQIVSDIFDQYLLPINYIVFAYFISNTFLIILLFTPSFIKDHPHNKIT